MLNILGMGAAVLGMQATVGALVAKALTTSTVPYYQANPGQSPVLALDVFLVQVLLAYQFLPFGMNCRNLHLELVQWCHSLVFIIILSSLAILIVRPAALNFRVH